jgi:hypothetical protein
MVERPLWSFSYAPIDGALLVALRVKTVLVPHLPPPIPPLDSVALAELHPGAAQSAVAEINAHTKLICFVRINLKSCRYLPGLANPGTHTPPPSEPAQASGVGEATTVCTGQQQSRTCACVP